MMIFECLFCSAHCNFSSISFEVVVERKSDGLGFALKIHEVSKYD